MRGITYSEFGKARDVLVLRDLPTPNPAKGEVLVRLVRSGVNPSDIRARAGGRPGVTKPPFPLIIPHSDGSGLIKAVGEGVSASRIGERVWIWNGQWKRAFGTAAEFIALPSEQAVKLDDGISFDDGAVLGIPGLTAAHIVLGRGSVAGKTMLISGGAGSVGYLAVQIAVASGAHVIATAHGDTAMQLVHAAGAHAVIDYKSENLAEAVLQASNGRTIDHVVEVEFGRNIDMISEVISEAGHITSFGSARDMRPSFPFYPLMFKAVTIELALIYLLQDQQRQQAISNLTTHLNNGTIQFRTPHIFPLEACAEAHDIVASGKRSGAVLLGID